MPIEPEQAALAPAMTQLGSGLTVTCFEPLLEQPPAPVTVTLRIAGFTEPAVQVMLRVPVPAVIDPLEIDQSYAAPAPALGTEAILPVEVAHTALAAVTTTGGGGLTVNVVEQVFGFPHASVAVTVIV